MLVVDRGDLSDPRIVSLLQGHVVRARAASPPCSAHALELAALRAADIRFFAAWDGQELLGIGALRILSAEHGEIKSMHTAQRARRRGVGSTILQRLLDEARNQRMTRVSLETGAQDYFEPARRFYHRHGFSDCGPFGDYRPDPASVFMTLQLPA